LGVVVIAAANLAVAAADLAAALPTFFLPSV
jgi:hypothetical protein